MVFRIPQTSRRVALSDNILRYRVLGTPLALAVTPYTGAQGGPVYPCHRS